MLGNYSSACNWILRRAGSVPAAHTGHCTSSFIGSIPYSHDRMSLKKSVSPVQSLQIGESSHRRSVTSGLCCCAPSPTSQSTPGSALERLHCLLIVQSESSSCWTPFCLVIPAAVGRCTLLLCSSVLCNGRQEAKLAKLAATSERANSYPNSANTIRGLSGPRQPKETYFELKQSFKTFHF
ncbi:hypothetical protein PAMP_024077 [Pampus punctatissimus]